MASSFLRALSGETPSPVDLGGGLGLGLTGLSMVPGPVGWLASITKGGIRANNMGYTNAARRSWGQEGLDLGQSVGGVLGLNSYGGGGSTDKLGDYNGTPVSPGGMVSSGGFLGMGATNTGAYTPAEAQRHRAASLYGSSFGTPVQSSVAPAAAQAQPMSAPMAAPTPTAIAQAAPATPVQTNALGVAAPDPFDRDAIARIIRESGTNGATHGNYSAGGGTMGGRGGYGGGSAGGGNNGRSGADTGSRSSLN